MSCGIICDLVSYNKFIGWTLLISLLILSLKVVHLLRSCWMHSCVVIHPHNQSSFVHRSGCDFTDLVCINKITDVGFDEAHYTTRNCTPVLQLALTGADWRWWSNCCVMLCCGGASRGVAWHVPSRCAMRCFI